MTYKGHVERGAIVVDDPVDLPDGTPVEIQPIHTRASGHHPDVERFAGVVPPEVNLSDYKEHQRKKHT